jgi:hypothetical protein
MHTYSNDIFPMTHSSSLTENLQGHNLSLLRMALRSGTLTKLWMLADVDKGCNTLSAMKDMAKNMMSGILVQKWQRQMHLTDGKKRMGRGFETHTIFSSGEECKSPNDL